MPDDMHEEPGWPTPEEEAAFDRAAEAGRRALEKQTDADRAKGDADCDAARRYRESLPRDVDKPAGAD